MSILDQAHIKSLVDMTLKEAIDMHIKWGEFHSAHEGFAILKEEVDELWDQVKINQKNREMHVMRKEAIQVAAMAIRFAAEVCDERRGRV